MKWFNCQVLSTRKQNKSYKLNSLGFPPVLHLDTTGTGTGHSFKLNVRAGLTGIATTFVMTGIDSDQNQHSFVTVHVCTCAPTCVHMSVHVWACALFYVFVSATELQSFRIQTSRHPFTLLLLCMLCVFFCSLVCARFKNVHKQQQKPQRTLLRPSKVISTI